jgi:transcriptional regulator with XRE-family HTH domain
MNYTLDTAKLATMVRNQRAGRGLREVAEELGDVSASTLCRIEAGRAPDMSVYLRICHWLNVSPAHFFSPAEQTPSSLALALPVYAQRRVIDLLESDPTLSADLVRVLTAMIQAAYQTK